MFIGCWAMTYLYEYCSLLIHAEFLTNALSAKSKRMSTHNRWYMSQATREISRRAVFDWERVLHTSPKILDKHIERESQ